MTRDEIQTKVISVMAETFEIDPSELSPETRLREDLDLDSIDAIDMAVKLQQMADGQRVSEDELAKIRTVDDITNLIESMLSSPKPT